MKVLLVDDNAGDVELARLALEGKGVDLRIAWDGQEALESLRDDAADPNEQPTDLVLLDLKLPRKDGLEVLAELRSDPRLRTTPVVVLTSSQAPRDLQRAYALGARACFSKPTGGLDEVLDQVVAFFRAAVAPSPDDANGTSMPLRLSPLPDATGAGEDFRRARHFAAIVESASDAIVGIGLDGKITGWNTGAENLYGYLADEALGADLSLIVPVDRRREMDALLARVRAGASVERMRTTRLDRHGREFQVELTVSPIRDSTGAIVGKSAIWRDITAQMQTEERYRLAVEASPTALLMVDAKGIIVMLNAEGERLFGYAREEIIGQSVDMLVPESFRDAHASHRGGFVAAPESRAMGEGRELFALRKDGVEVPVEIGLNPLHIAEGTFVLSSIVDVTERRQADARFRLAVEASPGGMVMVTGDGRIVLANREIERMFGYERGELVGEPIDLLVPLRFRPQHARHRHGFAATPEARTMGTGRDLYGVRKDGSELPVEVGLNPIETDGDGLLVLSTIVDITARKQAEEALTSQARELARSNEELEQFAYVASHDLQEPLRMVSSYTQLLAERYGDVLDEAGRRYIDYAQEGASRMRQMIDDVLAYSRVRTRGRELTPVRAERCLASALENLRIAVNEAEAEVDTGNFEARVLADRIQLESVFQNLLSNAIKFRRDQAPRVTVSAHRDGRRWVFAVRDNGIGIPPNLADRAFQMFERLQDRQAYPGTGVGLALCRRIIERHGGSIWVESDGEHGSTFLFALDAAPD